MYQILSLPLFPEIIPELEQEMLTIAEELDFDRAAIIQDRIGQMRESIGKPLSSIEGDQDRPTKNGAGAKKDAVAKYRVPRNKLDACRL